MRKFKVDYRQSRTLSVWVEAEDEDDAIAKADQIETELLEADSDHWEHSGLHEETANGDFVTHWIE